MNADKNFLKVLRITFSSLAYRNYLKSETRKVLIKYKYTNLCFSLIHFEFPVSDLIESHPVLI